MKLFTIIPVYRTASTLARCIDSVLAQELPCRHEIILVDDGSPDGSPSICDRYARLHANVMVIHKPNGGLSSARNAALDHLARTCADCAPDEYITFVDSDDTLDAHTLAPLMEQLVRHPEADMLEYSAAILCGHPTDESALRLPDATYRSAAEYWLATRAYRHTYAWNKIFRRSLFCDVRFPEGRNFEDAWTTPRLLGLCPDVQRHVCIITSSHGCYRYRWNAAGICATASYEDVRSRYEAHTATMQHLQQLQSEGPDLFARYDASWQLFMHDIVSTLIDMHRLSGRFEWPRPAVVEAVKGLAHRKHAKLKLLNAIGYRNLCRVMRGMLLLRHALNSINKVIK